MRYNYLLQNDILKNNILKFFIHWRYEHVLLLRSAMEMQKYKMTNSALRFCGAYGGKILEFHLKKISFCVKKVIWPMSGLLSIVTCCTWDHCLQGRSITEMAIPDWASYSFSWGKINNRAGDSYLGFLHTCSVTF